MAGLQGSSSRSSSAIMLQKLSNEFSFNFRFELFEIILM